MLLLGEQMQWVKAVAVDMKNSHHWCEQRAKLSTLLRELPKHF